MEIDRDKLRAALRKLGDEYVLYMLDEAIDLLPSAELEKLAARYLNVKQLRSDRSGRRSLLAEARAFDMASRAGEYYESFDVNSRNHMDKSMGTRSFISDCTRLLGRCVKLAPKGDAAEIREAIELILGLFRYIDEGHGDVIFFADEGGSWQVGVDWAKVLPALFRCLSQTVGPDEYARCVVEVVDEFEKRNRREHLAVALKLGTAAQREALQVATAETTP